ncbi:unnamed protein product [Clonostachys byssicola]|uniref:Peptidase S8/S53 domain-containing protein n=1 Tax=Clonostachys byssicola TaxID=160290 RepID=A0A9N9UCA3_9HYPO|nr:unnamed protein product [Clonostachys byssicola]
MDTDSIHPLSSDSEKPLSGITFLDSICSSADNAEALRILYNSDGMWPSNKDNGSNPLTFSPTEKSLRDFLDEKVSSPADKDAPADISCPAHAQYLTSEYRSLAIFLLAITFFQLCGSPWVKEPFQAECLSLCVTDDQPNGQWRLHAPCDLVPDTGISDPADSVAALGVLILELDAGYKASWSPDDESRSGKRSHQMRLRRLLREWEGDIIDENKRIARSCLDFDNLVGSLPDYDLPQGMKVPAIIYKYVLEPVLRHNIERSEEFQNVFAAIFGQDDTLPLFRNIVLPERVCAFDARDRPLCQDSLYRSKKFFNDADAFIQCIEEIRGNSDCPTSKGNGKKRIVLLDSGVDREHKVIRRAIGSKRINEQESKSFTSAPWNQDDSMHGTAVAELTMRVAPIAEIIIGKICQGRENPNNTVLAEETQAIDWATNTVKADIICLSLGYRVAHDAADTAVDNAIKAGVLVIAAASNSGILERRARPACLDGVICLHAANGYGCVSEMNPGKLVDETNFSTLGDGVHVLQKGEFELKAGTSYAAPIAAGFIACILSFIEAKVPGLQALQVEKLRRKKGMEAVLKKMSAKDLHGYDFIHPKYMCNWKDSDAVQRAVDRVKKALRDV